MMSAEVGCPQTGIQCLAAVAQYRGLQADPECLIRKYGVLGEEPDVPAVMRLASDIGLSVKAGTATWNALQAMKQTFPLLARLRNGHWVVVVGSPADDVEKVAIIDPLEPRASALVLKREHFCSQWSGEVVLLSLAAQLLARAA